MSQCQVSLVDLAHITIAWDRTALIFAGVRSHSKISARFCIWSREARFTRPLTAVLGAASPTSTKNLHQDVFWPWWYCRFEDPGALSGTYFLARNARKEERKALFPKGSYSVGLSLLGPVPMPRMLSAECLSWWSETGQDLLCLRMGLHCLSVMWRGVDT